MMHKKYNCSNQSKHIIFNLEAFVLDGIHYMALIATISIQLGTCTVIHECCELLGCYQHVDWWTMPPKAKRDSDAHLAVSKCFADLPFATIQTFLEYAEPDLANFETTKHFDMNTLCLLMCFMLGWHPMQELPGILGLRLEET